MPKTWKWPRPCVIYRNLQDNDEGSINIKVELVIWPYLYDSFPSLVLGYSLLFWGHWEKSSTSVFSASLKAHSLFLYPSRVVLTILLSLILLATCALSWSMLVCGYGGQYNCKLGTESFDRRHKNLTEDFFVCPQYSLNFAQRTRD